MILFDYYLQVELQDVLTVGEQLWREGDQPAVVPVQDLATADLAAMLQIHILFIKFQLNTVDLSAMLKCLHVICKILGSFI
jgi:hypothetical protein